ncbi:MAG: asparagine synthase (glutamine-hydrolyzing) [Solirubrobacterales bacterium]
MCGIVGQVRPSGSAVDPELPLRMCARLEHRGPDSRGVHLDRNVALGIQRLRVIDLETGDQPIYNEDRSVVVVLNGEIYNHRELRSELRRRGHEFRTRSDTEVIVHLYEELGPDCVERLDGMFAFALWDARRRRLLLARDRVGKKPLFYSLRDGVVSFASELHALLADREIGRAVDPAAVDAFLQLGYVPAPRSILSEVSKLPPAHSLLFESGSARTSRYWSLDYATTRSGPVEEVAAELIETLGAATRKRLVADVPVGAFLSGGIDSSAVVAAMAAASTEPVRTFSIGFDDDRFDELPHARRIAERFGTVHEEFLVRADAISVLPEIVRHHGEPFADPSAIPTHYLAALTRSRVTVALNGDGGDESFGGYSRYVANAVAGRLDHLPMGMRRALAAGASRLGNRGEVGGLRNKLRRLGSTLALDEAERYERYVSWIGRAARKDLYTAEFAAAMPAAGTGAIPAAFASASGDRIVDRMLEVDVSTYLVGDLLAKVDISTMAHGLEARSPFLDPDLMQFAASLPARMKVRGREKKWILRRALRGVLPDDLLDRPKQGFSVPLSAWLRGSLRPWARDILLDPVAVGRGYFEPKAIAGLIARHDDGADALAKPIWALIMLELWHREVIDTATGRDPVPMAV